MTSIVCGLRRGVAACVLFAATAAAPLAQAQWLGDAFRSPLTSSMLQTAGERKRALHRRSRDPYMAIIEQNAPGSMSRDAAPDTDPLSSMTRVTTTRANRLDVMPGPLPAGIAAGVGARVPTMGATWAPGVRDLPGATSTGMLPSASAMPGGLSGGCLPSLASLTDARAAGGACR